jgi:hypothetical protein
MYGTFSSTGPRPIDAEFAENTQTKKKKFPLVSGMG